MSYDYKTERPKLFTEEGMDAFLKLRDNAKKLIAVAGAVSSAALLDTPGTSKDDVWLLLACMDRMCEKNYLREVTGPDAMGQRRVFVAGREWA